MTDDDTTLWTADEIFFTTHGDDDIEQDAAGSSMTVDQFMALLHDDD